MRQKISGESGGADHQRKRHREEEQRDKRRSGNRPIIRPMQRPLCHLQERLEHDHQHGSLDAGEGRLDRRHLTVERVGHAERQHDESAGQDE